MGSPLWSCFGVPFMTLRRIALVGGLITVLLIVLYAALGPVANWQNTPRVDVSALEALRVGDMKKLVFHERPRAPVTKTFLTKDGEETDFSAYRGKVLLVNFWATWCAPCREEMPALDALQREMGGEDFAVLTIATGRNPVKMIEVFFDKVGVSNLPVLRDPTQRLATAMSVFGLPTSVVLDREGNEIARMTGEAEWDGADAKAVIRGVLGE
ncbi:MAG: TlpA family protein disulfide reductase [Rhodobacteraceae bacterium]|nr:TlpA family protein disulfide reductase [Paracoccaceae bacterium]